MYRFIELPIQRMLVANFLEPEIGFPVKQLQGLAARFVCGAYPLARLVFTYRMENHLMLRAVGGFKYECSFFECPEKKSLPSTIGRVSLPILGPLIRNHLRHQRPDTNEHRNHEHHF